MTIKITPATAHQRPSGKLYLGSNQLNLVNNEITLIELDTISTGFTDGIEDTTNHRITPGQTGFYQLVAMVTYTNIIANGKYDALIKISGSTWIVEGISWTIGTTHLSVLANTLVFLTASDYIELFARSLSGDNTVDLRGYERSTFLSVQRVR